MSFKNIIIIYLLDEVVNECYWNMKMDYVNEVYCVIEKKGLDFIVRVVVVLSIINFIL